MRIRYEADADVLVVQLSAEPPADAVEEPGGVIISYPEAGEPVSVELLNAAKARPRVVLRCAARLAKDAMTTRILSLELPEELLVALGSADEAETKAKEALVMELLREAVISQGYAAELLGTTRWAVLELMGRYRVPQGPLSPRELETDLATARKAAHTTR